MKAPISFLLTLLVALPLAGCAEPADDPAATPEAAAGHTGTPTAGQSPYAGNETRDIKALSAKEVDDLLAGKGMGYALAAELNSWPGPLHALELADALDLSATQREEMHAIRQRMLDEAIPLGRALVAAEARLDEAFAKRDVDAARVDALVADAARIEGELRAAHLRAHLTTTALLTPHQVMEYDRLRGYGDAGAQHDAGGGSAHHG